MKQWIEKEAEGFKISVVKWSDDEYELAILQEDSEGKWDLDYSIFPDVIKAGSSMQVYGTIMYEIAPAYFDKYGVILTY